MDSVCFFAQCKLHNHTDECFTVLDECITVFVLHSTGTSIIIFHGLTRWNASWHGAGKIIQCTHNAFSWMWALHFEKKSFMPSLCGECPLDWVLIK